MKMVPLCFEFVICNLLAASEIICLARLDWNASQRCYILIARGLRITVMRHFHEIDRFGGEDSEIIRNDVYLRERPSG